MNRLIVACVVLASHAACASAQDRIDRAGNAPGGHGIAVITAMPSRPLSSRLSHGTRPADEFGPGSGVGRFTLGRQYNLEYLTQPDVGDPLHGGGAARRGGRMDGGVRYYRSRGRTLSTGSSLTVDTLGGDPVADRAWGMSLGAEFGNFSLRAAHQNRHVARVHLYDSTGATLDAKNSIIAANFHAGWGTVYAAYSMNRGWGSSPLYNPDNPYGAGVASTASTDSRDTLVGVAVPLSHATTFLASFIHKNDRDRANRDASEVAIGASYVMSRKTDFYAALSHTVNTSGAGILLSDAARPSGSSAINVGMRHAF